MTWRRERTVIVGAGAAGLATADALVAEEYRGEILLLGDEPYAPYDRPPLSKQVLAGAWPVDEVTLRTPSELAHAGVELRSGTRVHGVDTRARTVTVDGAGPLRYDSLVVATGVRARRLPFGHELDGVHLLRTVGDTLALRADLVTPARVVVIGGGFLGAEAAAVCRELGHDVALVESQDLPMLEVLGRDVAGMVGELHREHGVVLYPGSQVVSITGYGGHVAGVAIRTGDGSGDDVALPADVVIVAIGAAPAVEWMADSGVPLLDVPARVGGRGTGGVRCDATGQATDRVWAVGDVGAWYVPRDHRYVRVEHRLTATEHARTVARGIVGRPVPDAVPPPYFWSDQYDLKLQSYGLPNRGLRCRVVDGSLEERRFVAAYLDDRRRVTAVVGAGRPRAMRQWRQAVIDRLPLPDALAPPPPAP